MTTDQTARTPEEMRGEDEKGRSDLIFRLADEVVIACDLGDPKKKPRGSRGTIAGACGDAWDAGYAAAQVRHAREVEALKANLDVERAQRVGAVNGMDSLQRDLAALRARIEAAAKEDDGLTADARRCYLPGPSVWTGSVGDQIRHLLSILDATRAANAGLREALRDAVDLITSKAVNVTTVDVGRLQKFTRRPDIVAALAGAPTRCNDQGVTGGCARAVGHKGGHCAYDIDAQMAASDAALASNTGERT